jgi:shikimate dehydrogenase
MVAALADSLPAATILGAGTTACAALAALRETGLKTVTVLVRNQARASDLLAAAAGLAWRPSCARSTPRSVAGNS